MRLFVAVDLDEETRRAAARLASRLAKRIEERVRPAPRIGWVTADRMHLTIRFIGHVEDHVAAEIQTALEPPFDFPAFDIELSGVGTFPASGSPRVMWIGVIRGSESLASLQRLVEDRLAAFDLEMDNRPLTVHLTLGRVRDRGSAAMRAALGEARFEPRTNRVTHVTLYQSRLSPKGPTYEPLVKAPLAGSSA
ncbi:MAG: RNA 2',3'-cyclic phosphodiesterase [Acidobacteria bacterium]|nr:RNA 2',3'-cyclic phosphodiesterase [Acidobacteriota bacterium]